MTLTASHMHEDTWHVTDDEGRVFSVTVGPGGTADDAIAAMEEASAGPTPEQIAEMEAVDRVEKIKAACRSRIYAVADETAQINAASNMAAGLLTPEDEAAYLRALNWVTDMRAACGGMIVNGTPDWTEDASWPDVPKGVAELAARF